MTAKTFLRMVSSLFLFSTLSALGQARAPATAAPPSTITRPESIQDSGLYDYWADMSGQGRAGGALLGKLAVEGEPLPWEPLLVAVTCEGKVVYTTQTDAKGNFGIVSVTLPGALGKQGDSQRQMETHFEGCLVQGAIPGFRSTTVTLTQHNLRDDPDIGTLMLSRIGRDAATTLSRTTETAPANAIKVFEKARAEMLDHNTDGAQRELKKAVQTDPNFAEAWLQLGKLQEVSEPQAARDSFSKALAADPAFVLPYEQLAALAAQTGNWKEVLDNTNHMAQLYHEGTAESWYLNAMANYQLGKPDVALASALKSLALDPRHSVLNTEQLLAVLLARKGDFAGALEHLRSSLKYVPPGPNSDLLKQQIAQLERRVTAK
ncbi:MAG: tetratricopeptide repeat protein [Terriglobales bacterium]